MTEESMDKESKDKPVGIFNSRDIDVPPKRSVRPEPERQGPRRTVDQLFKDASGEANHSGPMEATSPATLSNQNAYRADDNLIAQGLKLAQETGSYTASAIQEGYKVLADQTSKQTEAWKQAAMPTQVPSLPTPAAGYGSIVQQYMQFIDSLVRFTLSAGTSAVAGVSNFTPQTPSPTQAPYPGLDISNHVGQSRFAAPPVFQNATSGHYDPNNPLGNSDRNGHASTRDTNTEPVPLYRGSSREVFGSVDRPAPDAETAPLFPQSATPRDTEPFSGLRPVRFENSLYTRHPTTLNAIWHNDVPEGQLKLLPIAQIIQGNINFESTPAISTKWVFNESDRTQRLAIAIEDNCNAGDYIAIIVDERNTPCGQIKIEIDTPSTQKS